MQLDYSMDTCFILSLQEGTFSITLQAQVEKLLDARKRPQEQLPTTSLCLKKIQFNITNQL